MQKALFEMNVQLSNVISDIVGETGLQPDRFYRARFVRSLPHLPSRILAVAPTSQTEEQSDHVLAPGSPLTGAARFPANGIVWELNCNADLGARPLFLLECSSS